MYVLSSCKKAHTVDLEEGNPGQLIPKDDSKPSDDSWKSVVDLEAGGDFSKHE